MLVFCIFAILLGFAAHPIDKSVYDRLQKKNLTWTVAPYEKNPFRSFSKSQLQNFFGLKTDISEEALNGFHRPQPVSTPKSYDSRTAHSGCVGSIRNQLSCGSCWAFAAAETLSDNLCVTQGMHVTLSPQDLVSCDSSDNGCNGGTLPNVWNYMSDTGVLTDQCLPYTAGNGTVDKCYPGECTEGSSGFYRKYKCDHQNMLDSNQDIQSGVYSSGSVEVGMSVYEDFTSYDGGIYKHTEGQYLGGHAVKIVGWGQLGDTTYWIVANSWGPSWGESGFFRIDWSDKETAIGIGGGFNCGQVRPLPTVKPTEGPDSCKDISPGSCADISDKNKQCVYMATICLKTCGCCDYIKPDYCPS